MACDFDRPADVVRLRRGDAEYLVLSLPLRVPCELTEAEADVAQMATAGLTEHEIAQRRGVSRKTVHNQLQSIYRKLGVRDRAQLAQRLARGD